MSNTAKIMPNAFKNIIPCLVDKCVVVVSDMKQHNLHDLRAFVSPNVTACKMIKYMQQPTHSGLNKGKRKHPLFSIKCCLGICCTGSCSKDLMLHQSLQIH